MFVTFHLLSAALPQCRIMQCTMWRGPSVLRASMILSCWWESLVRDSLSGGLSSFLRVRLIVQAEPS